MFGRTLKISIAKDNGRNSEFNERRTYPDKQRCYECGQEGHLSFRCPSNVLGNREPPQKKNKKKPKRANDDAEHPLQDVDNYVDEMSSKLNLNEDATACEEASTSTKKKRYKQSTYLSDEEELSDWRDKYQFQPLAHHFIVIKFWN